MPYPESYLWDFDNDGQFDDASGEVVYADFGQEPAYVTLKATSESIGTATGSKYVGAKDVLCSACITWRDLDGNGPNTEIEVDASCSTIFQGEITKYIFDVDDSGGVRQTLSLIHI